MSDVQPFLIPTNKMTEFLGYHTLKSLIYETIILPNHIDSNYCKTLGLSFNVKSPQYILLFGLPGIGKSFLTRCIAGECNIARYHFLPQVNKQEIEMQCNQINKPSLIVLDDLDTNLFHDVTVDNPTNLLLDHINLMMNDKNKHKFMAKTVVICCSNMPHLFSEQVLNRFDMKIFIDSPNYDTRYEIINAELIKSQFDVELTEMDKINITNKCENYSSSDIYSMIKEISMKPLRECMDFTNPNQMFNRNNIPKISIKYFNQHFETAKNWSFTNEKQRNEYKKWNKKFNDSFSFQYDSILKRLLINGYIRQIAMEINMDIKHIQYLCVQYFHEKFMMDIYSNILH